MKSIYIQGSIAEGVTMNEIWQGHENFSRMLLSSNFAPHSLWTVNKVSTRLQSDFNNQFNI